MTKLPDTWVSAKIGDVCHLINGRAFKPSEWTSGGLPIIRIQNLNNPKAAYNHYNGDVPDRFHVKNGNLLFAWSGTPGTSFGAHVWNGGDAILNQHIFKMIFDESLLDKNFFRHAINQKLGDLIGMARGGVGLQHVTKGQFESTEIALPPYDEQRRIASAIDQALSKHEQALHELDEASSLSVQFKATILQSAFDGSLSESWREKTGADRARPVVLRDVVQSLSYGSSSKSSPSGKVPVLRMGNIQNGELDWTDLVYSSDEREIKKYSLVTGDVLFNRTNSPELVGKTALYHGERPAIYAGYLIRIKCSDKLRPAYLTYCLNSPPGREYCRSVKSDGVNQSNINASKLGNFPFPLPSLQEQNEIVELIERAFKQIEKTKTDIEQAKLLLAQTKVELLNKAFLGKLVPQNENDEPASLLLQKIVAGRQFQASIEKTQRNKSKTVSISGSMNMTKKRSEVEPNHLQHTLSALGGKADSRELWERSSMDIDEFYKQLRHEISAGTIREGSSKGELIAIHAA